MNILFISPSNSIGGAEISLLETINYLEKNNIRCFIIINKTKENLYGQTIEKVATKVFYCKIPNFIFKKIKPFSFKNIINLIYNFHKKGFSITAINYIRSVIRNEKIDIVHSNTVVSIVGKIAAHKENIPHVLHIREITGQSKHSLILLKGQDKLNFREKYGANDGLILNSNYCLEQNRQYFKGKVEEIFYNPINAKFEFQTKVNKTITIGMVANVSNSYKNHAEFINICKQVSFKYPNSIFRIYGNLPESENPYYTQLINQIEKLELTSSFNFMGLCNKNTIYSDIDILVHSYSYEAFGRIFIEAMAAGVPIVAAAGGGALELIQDDDTGLLYPPSNTIIAAEKILAIIYNKELREKLIRKGKEKAQEFLPEVVLSRMPDYYNKVLKAYLEGKN